MAETISRTEHAGMRKKTNPTDMFIGHNIRIRRKSRKMTQSDLARALNVRLQSVHKYEKGAASLSAGQLHLVAKVLGVPVRFFFGEGASVGTVEAARFSDEALGFLASPDAVKLSAYYMAIKDRARRAAVLDLVEGLSGCEAITLSDTPRRPPQEPDA